uniref:Uncharacterized protein n=1 Tax=Rhizophora mucronata TaxID=61149 RepID=A0A2P2PBN1_RHIMU
MVHVMRYDCDFGGYYELLVVLEFGSFELV